jgi:hypothetical protein
MKGRRIGSTSSAILLTEAYIIGCDPCTDEDNTTIIITHIGEPRKLPNGDYSYKIEFYEEEE